MISVIIPMYNASETILFCIDSVLQQTFDGEMEIIVINDGSTDDSSNTVLNHCNKANILNLILINKKNGGVSSARNAGMKVSKGDYIAFLDADDEWLPNKIATQLEVMNKDSSIDFLATAMVEPTKSHKDSIKVITLKNLIYKNYFQPSTVIMKRTVYETIGLFNEHQRYAEEGNYFLRAADKFKCVLLNQKLITYGNGKGGFGGSGLSSNLIEMEKGELMNLRFAYDQKYITRITYLKAVIFSMLKYLRRLIIVKLR